jgi:hypothetical protein
VGAVAAQGWGGAEGGQMGSERGCRDPEDVMAREMGTFGVGWRDEVGGKMEVDAERGGGGMGWV